MSALYNLEISVFTLILDYLMGLADDFKKGLDAYLGMPSFNVKAAMEREHCNSHDSYTSFHPSNNKELVTWPQMEWDYVVNFDPTKEYPGADDREGKPVHFYLTHANAKAAVLTETEVIGLRLYSGPMFMHYNMVLRGQSGKQYVTTIHAIVSGIIKLSSIMKLPLNRKVYRGLSGIELPKEFWEEDEYGAKGGVEMGIMSTTRNMGVAVQYSSYGQTPTVFEIDIGQVAPESLLLSLSLTRKYAFSFSFFLLLSLFSLSASLSHFLLHTHTQASKHANMQTC